MSVIFDGGAECSTLFEALDDEASNSKLVRLRHAETIHPLGEESRMHGNIAVPIVDARIAPSRMEASPLRRGWRNASVGDEA